MSEQIFPQGIKLWEPSEKAPDFIKGSVSVHPETLLEWSKQYQDEKGYIRLDLKEARDGKTLYFSLNTYKKSEDTDHRDHRDEAPRDNGNLDGINSDDIPF